MPILQRKKPNRYNYSPFDFICIFVLSNNIVEPINVNETMEMEYKESWILAMDEDMDSLINNDTWIMRLRCN
jgi:hypothetical protein